MENKKKEGSSPTSHHLQCDHQMAIEKIKRGKKLVNRLKEVIGYAGMLEPVNELFDGIQNSLNNALSGLQNSDSSSKSEETDFKFKEEDLASNKIRRRLVESSIVTPSPHYDGHQWRKYGEKQINGTKYERCYYRCTYSKELKCPATKTVQRVDGTTDPPIYSVIYYNHHNCNHDNNSNKNTPSFINSTNFPNTEASPSQEMKNINAYEQQFHGESSSMDMEMMKEFVLDPYFTEDFDLKTYYKKD